MVNRLGRYLLLACLFVLLATTFAFIGYSFGHRPYNAVEAELVFEATRVAKGFALYVDPARGAWEEGPPPSRYSVLYTPFWPWLLGHIALPTVSSVRSIGRAISILAWLFAHIAPVLVAVKGKRMAPLVASILGASLIFLIRNAPSGTPDLLAAALATAGLVQAVKKGRVDAVSAAFFTAAPFMKPSCLGIFAGAFLVCVLQRRPGYKQAIGSGLAVFALMSAASHVLSGGQWIHDIVLSTGQPISFSRWVVEFGSRSFVLGLPQVVVAFIAWRRKISWVVVAPLLTSIAWSTFSMAKLGSGSHYWHEPTIASIVAISLMANAPVQHDAQHDADPASRLHRAWVRFATLVLSVIVVIVTVPAAFDQFQGYAWYERHVERLARHCERRPGEVIVASNVVLELDLNGRLFVPEWQTSFLIRHGLFPVDLWRNDFRLPNVRWLLLDFDLEHPPSNPLDLGRVSVFGDELRDVIRENFDFDQVIEGQFVYRRKSSN